VRSLFTYVSSTAVTGDSATSTGAWRTRAGGVVSWFEAQSLFVAGLAVVAAFTLTSIPKNVTQDTWLALIAGRYVAAHGVPQHDTLFFLTHGARWIDQQWLAQLALYGLNQAGGLALYGIVYVALTFAGIGLAIAAGRALGATERHMLWVLPLAACLYFLGSFNIRTQGFAYILFSATLWLLAREARGASDRRVYLVFAILIAWGNLHGSVTLGVALAMVCGAVLIVQDLRGSRWRPSALISVRARAVLLLIGAPLCLFVNPYGLSMITYYRHTILNSQFSKAVTEWQPITSLLPLAVMVFLLAFVTIWVMGRSGRRMPIFDQIALVILGAAAVFAVRNIAWYGLGAIILLPPAITALAPRHRTSQRNVGLNLALAAIALVGVIATAAVVASKPSSWFESGYSQRALSTVEQVARRQPNDKIYADNRFADWLLWHDQSLAGRIAYDIRFELLTPGQFQSIIDLVALPRPREEQLLPAYRLLVLDPTSPQTTSRILGRSGTRVLVRSKTADVATWAPAS
jgi:MFS family permease